MIKKYLIFQILILFLLITLNLQSQDFGLSGYNKEFWLKADEVQNIIPANGANIVTWEDKSGSGLHFVQDGSNAVPTLSYNGFNFQPTVFWDATESDRRKLLRSNANFTPSTSKSYYVFVVSKPYGSERAWAQCIIKFCPTTNLNGSYSNGATGLFWTNSTDNNGSNVNRRITTGYTASNNTHFTGTSDANGFNSTDRRYGLISWICPNNNSATSGVFNQIWLNGRKSPFWDGTTGGNGANNDRIARGSGWLWHTTAQRIQLGQGGTNSYFPYSGEIQEVLLLSMNGNNVMPATDLQKVQSYFAVKYGLMLNSESGNWLNSDGDIIWDIADATYSKNIFGLGKDSGTGLHQKQSRSLENPNLTVFLGTIETLNLQNTNNTLGDKQYVMFGHNDSNTQLPINIATGTPFENGNIAVATGLNFQSGAIYKAQLTNLSSINVKMQVGTVYSYALVSTTDAFDQLTTKIYPVNAQGIVEVALDNTYKYVRFAGFSTGPGGVGQNLRLWLKAGDPNMLTIENLAPNDPKLQSYSVPAGAITVKGVAEWKDYVRGKTYSWYNKGASASSQQMPVYNPRSITMNYHPAVTFYGSGNTRSSYLRCNSPIASTAKPAKHTAIFLTNNNFSVNDWVYSMSFNSQIGDWRAPQYGVQKTGNNIVGRLRISGSPGADRVVNGSQSLFESGSTSMLLYYLNTTNLTFRFNSKEEVTYHGYATSQWDYFDMTSYSIISGGYDEDRTIIGDIGEVIIYEDELTIAQINGLESYLAFKYGITLRPNTAPNRYNYNICGGAISVWDGTQTSGKFVDFYNRVAAVVRDESSNLNNRESHSTESGTLLHLGVAGKKLGGNNPEIGELQDCEAVAFGHNNVFGFTSNQADACGEFTHRFNTVWLVHKVTNTNRPVKMLVGAENNLANNLGANAPQAIKDYYNKLNSNYEIYLIIADSPTDITNGNYKAVIPMSYINNEHQCVYEFSQEDTYITFGYKQLTSGCVGELDFNGKKTFTWNQYGATNYGTQNINVSKGAVSLGDGLSVTGSTVVYDAGIRTLAAYPRRNGSVLQLLRHNGSVGSQVTTTVNFNAPVEVDFNISGLDHYSGGYEEVTIIGYCSGGIVTPKLSYAGNKNQATYTITGNTATVTKKQIAGNGATIGMVNVTFDQAVSQIIIQYRINGTVNGSLRSVYVSAFSLRPVPPPPPINEDGLSFTKYSSRDSITTCERVNYVFEISNTNCEDKMVHFQDILNANLRWANGTLALDSLNETRAGSININGYGGTTSLTIDSLLVKGQTKIRFSATAYVDENYSYSGWQNFGNSARINYRQMVNSSLTPRQLYSVDKYTLDSLTIFSAEYKDRYDEASVSVTTDKTSYSENGQLTVTYTIYNPNSNISECYLYLDFNDNWQYVDNSFIGPSGTHFIYPDPTNSPYFFFAGSVDGLSGFTLPTGNTTFTVTFFAPPLSGIGYETIAGQTVREYFRIVHTLESNEDDPCVVASLLNTTGEKDVPFCSMNLQTVPSVSNCISVDLTQASITAGSTLPSGTTFKYYRDANQNGIVDLLELAIADPANITVSGQYLIRAINCDTLTNSINVTVKLPTTSSTVIDICSGALPYTWNDTTFLTGTAPGTYNHIYHTTNAAGCDSTATLTLTVSQPYSNIITASICAGQTYNLNGFNENTGGTYTQNLQTVDGCDSIVTLNLTVNSLPTAGITNNSATTLLTCAQPTISVTATGGTSYVWSAGLGNNANAIIANAGTYTVTATDANGCSNTQSISITSDATVPTANITNNTGSTILTCSLTSISLTATGGNSYVWSGGLGTNANAVVTSPGDYTVTVTNTVTGCSASTGVLITENITPPSVGITNNSGTTELTCALQTINVTATGGVTYVWDGGTSLNTAANSFTSQGVYGVTATGTNGCTNSTMITITENKTPPTVSITNNTGTTELTCNVTSISVTASGGGSYAWSGGLGNAANATITAPGTYVVTVTAANGCTSTNQITITQNIALPNVAIAYTGTAELTCMRPDIILTASGGISYNWSHSLGTNYMVTVNAPATYTVTATGSNGCQNTASQVVTENKTAPTAGIINNTGTTELTCSLTSISLTATGGGTYVWSNGLGTNANISINSAGTHEVIVTAANGCTAMASITLTENKTPPAANITNNSGTSILTCTFSSIQLTAGGGGTYSWSTGASTASINVTAAGSYTVTVTSSTNGCTASASEIITQNLDVPLVSIFKSPNVSVITCTNPSIVLKAESTGTIFSWNTGSINDSIIVTTAGTYTVTATNAVSGCAASVSETLTEDKNAPAVTITKTPNISEITCVNPTIGLTASAPGATFLWSNGSSTSSITATTAGTYSVTATYSNGCTSSESVTITENATLPNANITNNTGSTILTCNITGISLTATPAGMNYTWTNGALSASTTITTAGTHTVTVTNPATGCSSTASIVISQNNTVPNISGTLNVCEQKTVTLSSNVLGGTWSSSNTSVATINSSGVVNGLFAGTTTIRYEIPASGCYSEATFTVNPLPSISGTTAVTRGGTTQLTSNIPQGTWLSLSPNIATITAAGLVSGINLGQTKIVFRTFTGCTDTININVIETSAECCDYNLICAGSSIYNGCTYYMYSATEGYTSAPTATFALTNSNCSHDIDVTLSYSGTNLSDFTINDLTFQNTIDSGDTYTFSVTPNVGLPAGVYTMTVSLTCNGDGIVKATYQKVFDIRFKCNDVCNCNY